jgi:hypothetical protein
LEYRNFTLEKTKETEVYRENGVDKLNTTALGKRHMLQFTLIT